MERSHPGIVSFWGETGAVHLQDSEQVRDDTMVGVVRVSLARQPVLGADLQMGIERKPLVGVSDQAHDEPRRPRPHTAPILGSLSRSCKEFPGIDYLGSLPAFGDVPFVAGNQKISASSFRALQKAIVRLVRRRCYGMGRSGQNTDRAQPGQKTGDFRGRELQAGIQEHLLIFLENRFGYT